MCTNGTRMAVIYTSSNITFYNFQVCFRMVVTIPSLMLPLSLAGLQNRQFWFKQHTDQQLRALSQQLLHHLLDFVH